MVGHEERNLLNQLLKINEKLQDLRPQSGHSSRKIILLHDNARPHIVSFIKTRFKKFVGKFYRIRFIHRIWHLQITTCSGLWNIYSQASTSKIVKKQKNAQINISIPRMKPFSSVVFICYLNDGQNVCIAMVTILNNKYMWFFNKSLLFLLKYGRKLMHHPNII